MNATEEAAPEGGNGICDVVDITTNEIFLSGNRHGMHIIKTFFRRGGTDNRLIYWGPQISQLPADLQERVETLIKNAKYSDYNVSMKMDSFNDQLFNGKDVEAKSPGEYWKNLMFNGFSEVYHYTNNVLKEMFYKGEDVLTLKFTPHEEGADYSRKTEEMLGLKPHFTSDTEGNKKLKGIDALTKENGGHISLERLKGIGSEEDTYFGLKRA